MLTKLSLVVTVLNSVWPVPLGLARTVMSQFVDGLPFQDALVRAALVGKMTYIKINSGLNADHPASRLSMNYRKLSILVEHSITLYNEGKKSAALDQALPCHPVEWLQEDGTKASFASPATRRPSESSRLC